MIKLQAVINYIEKYRPTWATIENIIVADNEPCSHEVCEQGILFKYDSPLETVVPNKLLSLFNIDTNLPTHVLYYVCRERGIVQITDSARALVYNEVMRALWGMPHVFDKACMLLREAGQSVPALKLKFKF
ncbi:MAG: hypothetical protein KatS3mg045_1925 [Bellilinea sp.]|nr:MAG: hypothetical protein KatS3mg045_1925 [Bellilinea sp.]